MKRSKLIIIALLGLALFSCKKDEVEPDVVPNIAPNVVPVVNHVVNHVANVIPQVVETNHVRVTVNSLEVGDQLDVYSGNWGATVYLTRDDDKPYYFCNLTGNLAGFQKIGNCRDNTIELITKYVIYVDYVGYVTVEYLDSI